MKKFIFLINFVLLFIAMVPNVSAESLPDKGEIISYRRTDLGNGIIMIDEVIDHSTARSTDRTYEHRGTFYDGETVIAVIAFEATFRYDGTSVQVLSKTVTQTDTYEGWSYKQNSFTSSGGTVTLDAKLTKLLIYNQSFTMSLSCDKNGNISYS